MDPYEFTERLAEYARAHFSERDADDVELMSGAGEFDSAVDVFLVVADEGSYPVSSDLLDEVERYANEPDACELVPQWRKRLRRLWRATLN